MSHENGKGFHGERCNGRKHGWKKHHTEDELPYTEPGPWSGEGYCQMPSGWGTDHVGVGRCKNHGGSVPVKHGRYARYGRLPNRIGDLVQKYEDDPAPLDLLPELATARALFEDYLSQHEDNGGADAQEAAGLVSDITKIVARIEKIRSQNAISRPELFRVMGEMGRVVERTLDRHNVSEQLLEEIKDGWLGIRV